MIDYAVLTEECRGTLTDLIHEGYVCVVNENGEVIGSAGNPEAQVYYRSASKPLQAIPIIVRNLDKKYNLTHEETVIFSGSHLAESFHVNVLESIFKKASISTDELIMKPTIPGSTVANEERIKKGLPPQKIYHNCSGKHAALMILQKELTGDTKDYWKIDSPAQKEVMRTICELSEYPIEKTDIAIDGCGVPVFAVPMKNIAIAFKNLACLDTIKNEVIRTACERYVPLINEYPLMMRGTNFICSLINYDTNIIAKGGANGAYALGLKKERIGISIKIKDGTDAMWPIILKSIFEQIGYNKKETIDMLTKLNNGSIVNDNGTVVGNCHAVFKLK